MESSETKGQKPKWKGNGIAVWDWGNRISIKLEGHDYVTAFLQTDELQKPIPKKQEEVIVNG
tara:strand:- start:3058 stop:3243 length:186 start_codon:yes stop_codon:yes gene_type:complete